MPKSSHLVFVLLLAGTLAIQSAERPNVLFLAIDDQNDWIGCLDRSHPMVRTPNIDRIAARGTVFQNAHCQSPLCNPSRTSLMLSLRPTSTGIYGLAPWFRSLPEFAERRTLAQHFADHGYTTYTTGKIFHGGTGRKPGEWDHIGPGASGKPFPKERLVQGTPSPHKLVDWGVFDHRDEDKGDYLCASWAVEKLQNMEEDKPFFLSCGFFLPHVPLFATQKWFDLYPDDETVLPEVVPEDRADTPRFSWYMHWALPEVRLKFLKEADQWINITRSYLACVSFMDAQLGRVVDALEKSGHADDTIIVIWSDHGWHLGEKEITGKNTLWDPGTRVPLVFAGPGVTEAQDCNRPAELLDIYPTLCELAGIPVPENLEGLSLAPQCADAEAPRDRPAITCHNHDNNAVRSERYRYIRYADGSEEFYDMEKDPEEFTNLAGNPEYAALMAEHRAWIPEEQRKPAPGSKARIFTFIDGVATWEGKVIEEGAPIPEL